MGKNNTLFYNEELQKLQIEADEIFAIRKSELNSLSSDIKKLESQLKLSGIGFEFLHTSSLSKDTCDCLGWVENQKGEYRLMYCLFEDINSTWPILTKPLIETKIDIRVRFSKTLPIFFKAILKAVQDKT
jgi:hypothetical protein